jgi:hypothetical protein
MEQRVAIDFADSFIQVVFVARRACLSARQFNHWLPESADNILYWVIIKIPGRVSP